MAPTKSDTQNNTKHAEHQDETDIFNKRTEKLFSCVFRMFHLIFYFLFIIT